MCIIPRCLFTAVDAVYCAKFIKMVHDNNTAYFSTLQCFDRVIRDFSFVIKSSTEAEALRIGRFLLEILTLIDHWAEEKIYAQECQTKMGFSRSFVRTESGKSITFEEFRKVRHKWHKTLTIAFQGMLDSKEYMQIRNALTVLIKVAPVFPAMSKVFMVIEKKVTNIKSDEREDLRILASRYHALLELQKPRQRSEKDFIGIQPSSKPATAPTPKSTPAATGSPSTAKSNQPEPHTSAAKPVAKAAAPRTASAKPPGSSTQTAAHNQPSAKPHAAGAPVGTAKAEPPTASKPASSLGKPVAKDAPASKPIPSATQGRADQKPAARTVPPSSSGDKPSFDPVKQDPSEGSRSISPENKHNTSSSAGTSAKRRSHSLESREDKARKTRRVEDKETSEDLAAKRRRVHREVRPHLSGSERTVSLRASSSSGGSRDRRDTRSQSRSRDTRDMRETRDIRDIRESRDNRDSSDRDKRRRGTTRR